MATEFRLPELGENITSGTVAKVLVQAGDIIAVDQPVIEIETDKAVAEIPSPLAGTVSEVRVTAGQSVSPGDLLLLVEAGGAAASPPEPAPKTQAREADRAPAPASATPAVRAANPAKRTVLASPSVRRLAQELGVDLQEVPVSDPSGRASAEEVRRFAQGAHAAPSPTPASAPTTAAALERGQDRWGAVSLEPMNAVRRKTAEHLTQCWTSIPHVTHFDQADITDLERLRKERVARVAAQGGRLTTICFVLKVLAEGLKRFPRFNASIDLEKQQLVLKHYYHIGVAVETEYGLLVPPIRNVDQKSILDLARELPVLSEKTRARKLTLEEMQGATFTVSNLGGLGGTGFTPIINAPEVAILGLSRSRVEPVYRDGTFLPRAMLPLSLSYDHRVIDGADAARFTRWLAQTLEQPWNLFLES